MDSFLCYTVHGERMIMSLYYLQHTNARLITTDESISIIYFLVLHS